MKKRTKKILITIGIVLVFVAGIAVDETLRYFLIDPPIVPEPDKPSTQVVIKGKPGTISIEDERFYKEFYECRIISTGQGEIEHNVIRPRSWYPQEPKRHFIGFGLATSLSNGQWLYGGFISYRYRMLRDISITLRYFVLANDMNSYDTGIQGGIEFGIK